ncbi:hypothetical protein [Chryseobacterium sp.]|uniref:hypothetical protein n=1 Tax=Chryseobacterium sp. TaxID=1871047 RepID=UPI002899034D|nr:hypothetical protein [Chryseobacterium sp.]
MKKLLLTAVLFAGTTFAFANNNVVPTTENLKTEKLSITAENLDSPIEKKEVKKICGKLIYTEVQESVPNLSTGTWETVTTGYYTHVTYWC